MVKSGINICLFIFSYRVKVHCSTRESRWDALIPTETSLEGPKSAAQLDADDYKVDVLLGFSFA